MPDSCWLRSLRKVLSVIDILLGSNCEPNNIFPSPGCSGENPGQNKLKINSFLFGVYCINVYL